MSKRNKRVTRNSKKAAIKPSEQLCLTVTDHGATISSSNALNHFGFAPFSLTITVEPSTDDLEPQPLSVQLVFEDGQQIDTESNQNHIAFRTSPDELLIDSDGHCHFSVHIDTYSMFHNNRAFKLVFNLADTATRHIRPTETKPFRLVKHRLEIVTEPDDTFFKDEGGRANCLHCKILLKDCKKAVVKNRDIPLTAKLVYEDMSVAQSSRDILEVLTQNLQLKKGQSAVDFRINEVSKNHNKRAFRVLFECNSNDALYNDISSCVTSKIMVKSKRTKKKGPRWRSKGGAKARKRKRESKIKKQSPSLSASDLDSEALSGRDLDSEDGHNEPIRKKRRHSLRGERERAEYGHEFAPHLRSTLPPITNGNMKSTHFVPPALTGILPSIRPGALPRIAHNPPPFAAVSKKNAPHFKDQNECGGGVLGGLFSFCERAEWVMQRLEWSPCGFEYDEATHSIDVRRPLYRCSFCLKYRNEAGWGEHAAWCQLKMALKEYEQRVKGMHSEFSYQQQLAAGGKEEVQVQGGMSSLEQQSSPPPAIPMELTNDRDDDKRGRGGPSAAGTVSNGPFGVSTHFEPPPTSSNGTSAMFPFAAHYQSTPLMAHSDAVSVPFVGGGGHRTMPSMNGLNHSGNMGAFGMPPNAVSNEVKPDKLPALSINLPPSMPRIASVSRMPSQHGFDAFDANQQFVGSFDGAGDFLDAEQLHQNENGAYRPSFDPNNVINRNHSDDFLFYNNLRNTIFADSK